MMTKRILIASVVFCLFLSVSAQTEKFKAAYTYRFASALDWSGDNADFNIGVFGSSTVFPLLETIAQTKKINEKSVKVSKISAMEDIAALDIIYIPSDYSSKLAEVFASAKGNQTLVIADGEGLAKEFAGISFVEKDGKVLYEINKSVMASCGLFAPSLLLKLAIRAY